MSSCLFSTTRAASAGPFALRIACLACAVAMNASGASAQNGAPAKPAAAASGNARAELRPHRVARAPVIDGVLDDEAWQEPPMETGEWLSYNPLYGDQVPQKTKVWVASDADYIYFAFQCDDPEPAGIARPQRQGQ